MHCSSLSMASSHASANTFSSFRLNFPGRLDENVGSENLILQPCAPTSCHMSPEIMSGKHLYAHQGNQVQI